MNTHWYKRTDVADFLRKSTGAEHVIPGDSIQQLWSDYGEIRRFHLKYRHQNTASSSASDSVIAKWVAVASKPEHPRGWNTSKSHRRKLHSYEVERVWYERFATQCGIGCPVARLVGSLSQDDGYLLLLSDLDHHYPARFDTAWPISIDKNSHKDQLSPIATSCLRWLANFHALFLDSDGTGLWQQGTYWYLDTRPDEFDVMASGPVKDIAHLLDQHLKDCQYQTLVHGDAKIANFCFTSDANDTAAVDFQYVGRGIGVRDVAYFLGSCLDENELQRNDQRYLDFYFNKLTLALERFQPSIDAGAVCDAWRALYPIAWTDFYRFLLGWMPDHPKTHGYTRRLADQVLRELD